MLPPPAAHSHDHLLEIASKAGITGETNMPAVLADFAGDTEFLNAFETVLNQRVEAESTFDEYGSLNLVLSAYHRDALRAFMIQAATLPSPSIVDDICEMFPVGTLTGDGPEDIDAFRADLERLVDIHTQYYQHTQGMQVTLTFDNHWGEPIVQRCRLKRSAVDIMEVALRRSNSPSYDCWVLSQADVREVSKVTVAELEAYYDDHKHLYGLRAINDKKYFAHTLGEHQLEPREHGLRLKLAGRNEPLQSHDIEPVVDRVLHIPDKLEDQLIAVVSRCNANGMGFSWYDPLFRTINASVAEKDDRVGPIQELLKAFATYPGNNVRMALEACEEVLDAEPEVIEHFAEELAACSTDDIAGLLKKARVQHYQRQYPEKDLDRVLDQFRAMPEPPSEPGLTAARDIYLAAVELEKHLLRMSEEEFPKFRREVERAAGGCPLEFKVKYSAFGREWIRRKAGHRVFNTQLLTAYMMTDHDSFKGAGFNGLDARGCYARVLPGEGKTYILGFVSQFYALQGHQVDVATSNPYLAKRDAADLREFHKAFGIDCDPFEFSFGQQLPAGEAPGILIGSYYDFIFERLDALMNGRRHIRDGVQDVVLCDEFDALAMDHAEEMCGLSAEAAAIFTEKELQEFRTFVADHDPAEILRNSTEFRDRFMTRFEVDARRVSPAYVRRFLRAAARVTFFERFEQYIKDEQKRKIIPVDLGKGGRVRDNCRWTDGTHEFIHLEEELALPEPRLQLASGDPVSHFLHYDICSGVTGTPGDLNESAQVRRTHNMIGFYTPPHQTKKLTDHGVTIHLTDAERDGALPDHLKQRLGRNRHRFAIAFGTTLKDTLDYNALLTEGRIPHQVLNDHENLGMDGQPASEADIIRETPNPGRILVTNGVGGRGADSKIRDSVVRDAGGGHAIQLGIAITKRDSDQAFGRIARQGDPGSCEVFASFESDFFIQKVLPIPVREALREVIADSRFGPSSDPLGQLKEFLQISQNIIASFRRELLLIRAPYIESALEHHRAAAEAIAAKLPKWSAVATAHDSRIATAAGMIRDDWLKEFDRFGVILDDEIFTFETDHIDADSRLQPLATETESAGFYLERLLITYKEAFGVAYEDRMGSGEREFLEMVDPIFNWYRNALGYLEQRMGEIDISHADRLLDGFGKAIEKARDSALDRVAGRQRPELQ